MGRTGTRPRPALTTLAVDWSGAVDPAVQRRAIWMAEASRWPDGTVVVERLEAGLTRREVVARLLGRIERPLLVGFDFAFGFPSWFVAEMDSAPEITAVWEHAAARAEDWLAGHALFWGRPGRRRPHVVAGRAGFRECEWMLRQQDLAPKSVFQVGGAGSVGTGTLRGLEHLTRLRHAGFAVWPFDEAGARTVVEVYPAACVPAGVVKSRVEDRESHLARLADDVVFPGPVVEAATRSADAFDAVVAAVALARAGAPPAADSLPDVARLEGWVWPDQSQLATRVG